MYRWPVGSYTLYRIVRWVLTFLSFVRVAEFFRGQGGLKLELNIPSQWIRAKRKGGGGLIKRRGRNIEWVQYYQRYGEKHSWQPKMAAQPTWEAQNFLGGSLVSSPMSPSVFGIQLQYNRGGRARVSYFRPVHAAIVMMDVCLQKVVRRSASMLPQKKGTLRSLLTFGPKFY